MDDEIEERLAIERPILLRFARKTTGEASRAEDLTQDALLAVWRKLKRGDQITELRAYLRKIVRNGNMRGHIPVQEMDEDALPPDIDRTNPHLAMMDVLSVIATMPKEHAMLLYGCALGQTYAELARASGVKTGTIMSRLSRARAQLRVQLDMSESEGVADLV